MKIGDRFLLYTFLLLLPVMFILPFFSVDTYSILKNTTSQLGAQNTVNAWMMNTVFILVGISCLLEAWMNVKGFPLQKLLLIIFGLGLFLIGIFRHAPITEGLPYNAWEDRLHSVFATVVGISFTFYAVSSAFIEKAIKHRVMDLIVGFTATILSMLMFSIPDYSGVWQRAIFIVSFSWLIVMLERIKKRT